MSDNFTPRLLRLRQTLFSPASKAVFATIPTFAKLPRILALYNLTPLNSPKELLNSQDLLSEVTILTHSLSQAQPFLDTQRFARSYRLTPELLEP